MQVMTDRHPLVDFSLYNERSLQTLDRAIALSQDHFSLILVRCNYASLQARMVERLAALCREEVSLQRRPLHSLYLPTHVTTLYTTIQEALIEPKPLALSIFGLESVAALEQVLSASNQVRDEFRKRFEFPLILWVNEEVLSALIRFAPDFKSWAATSIKFELETTELLEFLQQQAGKLFPSLLELGATETGYEWCIPEPMSDRDRRELEAAIKDLQGRGIALDPDLEASVEFLLGRDEYARDRLESAFSHYQHSLSLWQQQSGETLSIFLDSPLDPAVAQPFTPATPPSEDPNATALQCLAVVLFHLGLLYCRHAQLHQAKCHQYWEQAREYLERCIEILDRCDREDLLAKFITLLGEVLARLQRWDELQDVAQKAIGLHENQPIPLARDRGFLAEVALAKGEWEIGQTYAQKAIETLATAPIPNRQDWGLYLYLLGKTQAPETSNALAGSELNPIASPRIQQQIQTAIDTLNLAKQVTTPARDPQLYIGILKQLRSLYFQRQDYLQAFHIKQQQRAIETLYGFRAFVGAGLLQPPAACVTQPGKNAIAPLRTNPLDKSALPHEIAAAGRQHHIDRLLERMTRADKKLTILYGDSGVGKSSLVNAGFVPALQGRAIGDRLALPITLRSYTDWIPALCRRLSDALHQTLCIEGDLICESANPDSSGENSPIPNFQPLLAQLRQNQDRNLLTILIFDQFEEFFFVNKTQQQRQQFYQFLRACLDIPFIKIVLSLRTDFLHYLLECERLCNLEAIGNDILSKEIRYHLGDFSSHQATEVIERLTERSQFYLEAELIDALVNDLANETGQVRPIELQLVGAQLQDEDEKITTLAQYQQLGSNPKQILIARSLVQAIRDCGPENKKTAWEVLYGLTHENNTRPLKTQEELATGRDVETEKLDLILKILEGAGLVFIHPEESGDRYQLVHDYLVYPIRQKYESDFGPIARLVKAEEAKKMTQVQLEQSNQKLKHQRASLGFLAILLSLSTLFALAKQEQANISAENTHITAISASSEALYVSNREFDALVESLRAWRKLKQAKQPDPETKLRVVTALQQAVYGVRERNRLEGHGAEVWSVTFSPDGQTIASGGNDSKVLLWNRNGSLQKTLIDPNLEEGLSHTREVTSVTFSPNGEWIASTSRDNTAKIWRRDGTLYKTLTGHSNSVYSSSFSPDSEYLATASHDKTVRIWRVADGSLVTTLKGHTESVNWVAFSPDGQLLASASDDRTVKIWTLDGTLQQTLPPHGDWVTAIAFSPDGRYLISAGVDKTIRVTPLNGEPAKSWKAHDGIVFSLSFSPDGRWFASAADDHTIKIWKLDGTEIKTLKGHSGRVTSIDFSPDGMNLVSASFDKTVRIWTLKDTFLKILAGEVGHSARVSSISFSPSGKYLASGSWDNTVKIWNLDATADAEQVMTLNGADGHASRVFDVSFSPNGKFIASASQDCTVKLWSSKDGKLVKTFVDPHLEPTAHPNGDCSALQSHSDRVYTVSFSPDGQLIASGSRDTTVKIWRLDGTLVATLHGHSARINSVVFSPNGRAIASASDDKTIKLWSANGVLIKTFAGPNSHQSYVSSVSFSPDGQRIASASWDNTVKIWNVDDGSLDKTLLQGYSDSVESVSFSPDGRLIVSASWDGTVKLWSLKDGTLLKTLQGHTSGVLDVAFSPDGRKIASAGDDRSIILWNLDLEDLTLRACTWLHDYLQYSKNISEADIDLCEETIKKQRFSEKINNPTNILKFLGNFTRKEELRERSEPK